MSRHERDFDAAAQAWLDEEELARLAAQDSERERHHAIARGLAGAEDWRAALAELGGTFAGPVRAQSRLTPRKAD